VLTAEPVISSSVRLHISYSVTCLQAQYNSNEIDNGFTRTIDFIPPSGQDIRVLKAWNQAPAGGGLGEFVMGSIRLGNLVFRCYVMRKL